MSGKSKKSFDKYHAHVYFDRNTVDRATALCNEAGKKFELTVGRVHRQPVGPHPCWSCQLAFDAAEYEGLISWLETNRQGLNILIHGLTGNDLEDHTDNASWLGEPQQLKLDIFK